MTRMTKRLPVLFDRLTTKPNRDNVVNLYSIR